MPFVECIHVVGPDAIALNFTALQPSDKNFRGGAQIRRGFGHGLDCCDHEKHRGEFHLEGNGPVLHQQQYDGAQFVRIR